MMNHKKMSWHTVLVLVTLLITSCGTARNIHEEAQARPPLPVRDVIADLEKEPGILTVHLPKNAFLLQQPDRITIDRDISISFRETPLNIALESIAKVVKLNLLYEKKETEKYVVSINYTGKLAGLLGALSEQTGMFFLQRGDSILVKDKTTFTLVVPSYPDLLKEISNSVLNLGGERVAYDALSGTLTVTVNHHGLERLNQHLDRLRQNAALVTMRITLLAVTLNEGNKTGIDWTKMALGYQSLMKDFGTATTGTGSTTGTTNTTSAATADTSDRSSFVTGGALLFNATGANLLVDEKRWSLDAFVNLIETYGVSRLMHNIFLETLSGTQGKLSSVTKTPYVKQIGAVSLSSTTTAIQQTANTDEAKDGVEMNISPWYSKTQGSLSIKMKVSVLGVGRFITLSAGSQLGTLSQPVTTERAIETYLRLKPGQIAVIGGLIIDKNAKDATGLPFDSYLTKATDTSKSKEELVIVVRPVIIQFVEEI